LLLLWLSVVVGFVIGGGWNVVVVGGVGVDVYGDDIGVVVGCDVVGVV